MKKVLLTMLAAVGLTALAAVPAKACTSYYVGSDLTEDGSTLFGRTEDIGARYDKVFQVIPSKEIQEGEKWKDESGYTQFQGDYKDGLTKTYRYTACRDSKEANDGLFGEVGVNEKGVSMSATTTAGNSAEAKKADPFVGNSTGISEENYVDYVLCQASNAREGVEILADAIDKNGVWKAADGVFIADKNEVWYFEILSGHQYCAIKMPEDKAAIIPNCLVIGDVDLDDKENVYASDEVKTLAEAKEIFVGPQTDMEGADINIKLTYGGKGYDSGNADRIRAGQYILTGEDNTDIYTENYQDIFFDIPSRDVTVEKLYQLAGSQYEEFEDFSGGRPSGLGSIRYIGVASSAECHIMQIRSDMPAELATVEWLSLSSAAYSPMVPFYGALLTDVPESYKEEAYEHSDTSAYWTFQDLDAYARKNVNTVGEKIKAFYKGYVNKLEADQKTVDAQMMDVYNSNPSQLEQKATDLGISIGTQTVNMAKKLNAEVMSEDYTLDFTTDYNDINYSLTAKPAEPETPSTQQPQATEPQAQTVSAPAKTVIKKLKNRKGKKLQVKFKKVSGADGYEIAYSKGVNFGKKKTTVKSYNAAKNVRTIKKLKKGKRYFVKVRAYKMNGTQKVYGKWSQVKVVKIKK
ncbi:hypothetical protein B5E53_11200 [Eubacterium sp. An11]|uniref:C69 family dipeptidase n=1 Tax=Eubacterium sp. An11 TaxID=1965542 RepID=UPI000B3864AC|nr:C69 family dipeptidase [Eubacterium sp. An11]OUQ66283.1 hypothetical protein B5E53_11200 [Eubacterium sp. An11]